MVTLVALVALSQRFGTSDYTSPPLDWLKGRRIHWKLRPVCLIVTSKASREAYQKRYVEFLLQDTSKSLGPSDFNGQFNFWSQPRLKSLGLLDKAAEAKLRRHKIALLHEPEYISCLVPLRGSDYLLYVQMSKPPHLNKAKEDRVRQSLTGIEVR